MSATPLLPGTLLRDRYRIGDRLATGRASATYRADDLRGEGPCVVKELSVGEAIRTATGTDSWDSDDFTKLIELFEREARTLAHLDHPGIPRLIEHFTVESEGDTRLYIVQELVEGETLAALVASGKHFTEREARAICRGAAQILAYIHDRSPPLVHRDVKPDNVILGPDGTVHLVDFGSVRTSVGLSDFDGKTIVGTFGYMPLEQYEGRATPASDIYALGGTLVFLLSHRAPHELPREGLAIDFRGFVNVSEGFADVIERMLEPDPASRYGSAAALLGELKGRPPTRPRSSRDRTRVMAVAAGFAVVLLVGSGVSMFMSARRTPGPPDRALPTSSPVAAVAPRPRAVPVRPEGDVLAIDVYADFTYRDSGFPMRRAVGQTALGILTEQPHEGLLVPSSVDEAEEAFYGALVLGNTTDNRHAFVLFREGGEWGLFVDTDNDEDLTDEGGPHRNQGTGKVMAAAVTVEVQVETASGTVGHPYHLWMWFDPVAGGERYSGRFYALNHWAGRVEVGGALYDAVAFEASDHDALLRESGVCIDLDRDGECREDDELFYDGATVPFPERLVRLELRYR